MCRRGYRNAQEQSRSAVVIVSLSAYNTVLAVRYSRQPSLLTPILATQNRDCVTVSRHVGK
jgi:predicted glycosyltransferase